MLTLSPSELHQLTGYKSREKQREWLAAEGVPFRCDSHGRHITLNVGRVGGEVYVIMPTSHRWRSTSPNSRCCTMSTMSRPER